MLIGALTAFVVIAYNVTELIEKHHRRSFENVRDAIAATIGLITFYCIAMLLHTLWVLIRGDECKVIEDNRRG